MVMRLVTMENVHDVIAHLEDPFRGDFLEFAREAYTPEGARIAVAGAPLGLGSLAAIRSWFQEVDERRRGPISYRLGDAA